VENAWKKVEEENGRLADLLESRRLSETMPTPPANVPTDAQINAAKAALDAARNNYESVHTRYPKKTPSDVPTLDAIENARVAAEDALKNYLTLYAKRFPPVQTGTGGRSTRRKTRKGSTRRR
jgi:hypothetical protein